MGRELPEAIRARIFALIQAGELNNKQIAQEVGLKATHAHRTIARYRKQAKAEPSSAAPATPDAVVSTPLLEESRSLDTMSRDERFKYVSSRIKDTARFKVIIETFTSDEQDFFLAEYFNVLKSTDSINEAEEQQLFLACIEYVLAYRALSMHRLEENLYKETMRGLHEEGDAEFRKFLDDRFLKQYENHSKAYQALMRQLKLSREQRLKEVRSERKTFVDLIEEMSHDTAQSTAAEEIERLSKLRDEELKTMLENGHIFGVFGGEE